MAYFYKAIFVNVALVLNIGLPLLLFLFFFFKKKKNLLKYIIIKMGYKKSHRKNKNEVSSQSSRNTLDEINKSTWWKYIFYSYSQYSVKQ